MIAVFGLLLLCLGDPLLVEVENCGLDFTYHNGMTGAWAVPEEVGGGVALFDGDGDGDLDIFLIQAGHDPLGKADAKTPPSQYFRNDSRPGQWRFVNQTAEMGVAIKGYGMGVTTGDVDGDGNIDLYLTMFGSNYLLRNLGAGRFEDITAQAGVAGSDWSTSASFFDMDGDGDLDLYVANYLVYTKNNHKQCRNQAGLIDYCGPNSFEDARDRLYRNLGDGRFEDISDASGIRKISGSGLGVVALDGNGDSALDLYVANDADPNFLWIGDGKGGFVDDGLLSGLAFNGQGVAEAGMGLAVGDVDGNGMEDIFVSHLTGETHTLYMALGDGLYEDRTEKMGLAMTSLKDTGFGTGLLDLNRDGWLDLVVVNGTVMTQDDQRRAGDPYPLKQADKAFLNLKGTGFKELKLKALERALVSRGAAFGDLDNDGDRDIVIVNNQGPARLLENRSNGRWLGLTLPTVGAQGLGVRATLTLKSGRDILRVSRRDGSFQSASDARILFAIPEKGLQSLVLQWPDGKTQQVKVIEDSLYLKVDRKAK